jgi:hypothetical protein
MGGSGLVLCKVTRETHFAGHKAIVGTGSRQCDDAIS